jgi:sialate O-acetylesterase
MKKQLLILAGILLFHLSVFAQTKVACIGNSITYGFGIPDCESNSYPAKLQKIIGQEWEVKNFGVSGANRAIGLIGNRRHMKMLKIIIPM